MSHASKLSRWESTSSWGPLSEHIHPPIISMIYLNIPINLLSSGDVKHSMCSSYSLLCLQVRADQGDSLHSRLLRHDPEERAWEHCAHWGLED